MLNCCIAHKRSRERRSSEESLPRLRPTTSETDDMSMPSVDSELSADMPSLECGSDDEFFECEDEDTQHGTGLFSSWRCKICNKYDKLA